MTSLSNNFPSTKFSISTSKDDWKSEILSAIQSESDFNIDIYKVVYVLDEFEKIVKQFSSPLIGYDLSWRPSPTPNKKDFHFHIVLLIDNTYRLTFGIVRFNLEFSREKYTPGVSCDFCWTKEYGSWFSTMHTVTRRGKPPELDYLVECTVKDLQNNCQEIISRIKTNN